MIVAVVANEVQVDTDAENECHPECRWQCDDPVCPAKCHPVCERPKCQIQCEETACARCKVHCDKPKCNVRCPKDMCEKHDCPKCETVCSPANCRTSCIAPEPVCTPMCEETKCDWKCKKPNLCPRPKCELVCDKPACEAKKPPKPKKRRCCNCDAANVAASIEKANAKLVETAAKTTAAATTPDSKAMPTFMEVFHTIKFNEKATGVDSCCACAN